MPDGRIEPRQVERFLQVGRWLNKYGESIYGTRGGPYVTNIWGTKFGHTNRPSGPARRPWGVTTRKGRTLYVHVLNWTGDVVELPLIDGRKVTSSSVLTGGKATVRQGDDNITISVPAEQRDVMDTIIKIEFDRTLDNVKPINPEMLLTG